MHARSIVFQSKCVFNESGGGGGLTGANEDSETKKNTEIYTCIHFGTGRNMNLTLFTLFL